MKKGNTSAAKPAAKQAAKPAAKLVVDMKYDFQNLQQVFKNKLLDNYSVMFKEYEKKVFSRDENNFLELSTKKERDVNIKKILLTDGDILLIQNIKNIRESYIIIDFLCYSDTLLENKLIALILSKENTGLDKIVQFSSELDENKSIALINNDEKYNKNFIKNEGLTDNNIKAIHNYVYFLDSSSANTNNNDNSNVLLIWKFNIYRIVNLDYKKGNHLTDDFKIKRIKIYILYRLFYYFLNILINLQKLQDNNNYAKIFNKDFVINIIKHIESWSNVDSENIKYMKDFDDILKSYDEFFKELIKNILINLEINPTNKDDEYTQKELSHEGIIDYYIIKKSTSKNKDNLIYDFLTVLYINIKDNIAKNYDKAIYIYNIYKSICLYKDENFEKIEEIKKVEDARKKAEEEKRLEEAEEKRLAEEEKRLAEEEKRLAEEASKKAEAEAKEEATRIKEQKRLEEDARKKAEAKAKEEASKKAEAEAEAKAKAKEEARIEATRIKEAEIKEEAREAEAIRLAERDASNMLLFTVENNLKKVFNSFHYIIRREKMSSGQVPRKEDSRENHLPRLVQNNFNAVFSVLHKDRERLGQVQGQGQGLGQGKEDSRENHLQRLVQNNFNTVFLVLHKDREKLGQGLGRGEREEGEGRGRGEREEGEGLQEEEEEEEEEEEGLQGEGEGEGKQKAILYNFVQEKSLGNNSNEYTILSKKSTEPSYDINELLNAYNYVIHIKGNLIIKYNIQRYYNIRHILKIIYEQSNHIIIISKKKDFDNEGLYQYKSYNKINLIIIYSENILPNFNKLILEKNKLDSTIEEFESIKSNIYGVGQVEGRQLKQPQQTEKKTSILANMRTKIVSAAKKTANIVGKAPKAISYIGRKLFASKTPPRKNTPSLEATFGILNLLDSLHKKPTENPEGLLKKVQQSTATPSLEANNL